MVYGSEKNIAILEENDHTSREQSSDSKARDGQNFERPWSTHEIRKNSGNWTLAGDVGLLNFLHEFSHQLISRTHEMEKVVDSLAHKTKGACAKVNNVINDFQMLSNVQFVENRVYDEEVQDSEKQPIQQVQQKSKEQREAEMVPRVKQALELGLSVLDQAFERINVEEISDSEEEDDQSAQGRTILEPKDPYETRPLPFIIGSEDFQRDDFAGLRDIISEDIVEVSVEEESVSASEESSSEDEKELPLDIPHVDKVRKETIPDQNFNDEHSESEGSDLFEAEVEENGYDSDLSVDKKVPVSKIVKNPLLEELITKTKVPAPIPEKAKPELSQSIPTPKKQEKIENDDLFASEDDFLEDEESPFRKKTGLFTTDTLFASETEEVLSDDLFEEKERAPTLKENKPLGVKNKKDSIFFDDDENEQDIFGSFSTPSKSSLSQAPKIVKNIESDDSSKKLGNISSSSSAVSIKDTNTFGVLGGQGSSDSLFGDDSDGDDLFAGTKKDKKFDFNNSGEDLFSISTSATKNTMETKPNIKVPAPLKTEKKTLSLFEESDSFDLFSPASPVEKVEQKATIVKTLPPEESKGFAVDLAKTSKRQITAKTDSIPSMGNDSLETVMKKNEAMEYVQEIESQDNITFDSPVVSSNTLNVINKDRIKIQVKRRKPTRKSRQAVQSISDGDSLGGAAVKTDPLPLQKKSISEDPFTSLEKTQEIPPAEPLFTGSQVSHKKKEQEKKNIMSQLISEVASSKVGKRASIVKIEEDEDDLFSTKVGDKQSFLNSDFTFLSPTSQESSEILVKASVDIEEPKQRLPSVLDNDSTLDDDDLFSGPAFKDFKSSISDDRTSLFSMDDEDDDIFKSVKPNPKSAHKSTDDIFADPGDDIFAGVDNEKYEMFPSQLYSDDDDIFGGSEKPSKDVSVKENKQSANHKSDTKTSADIFDDPLNGFSLNV